MTSTPVGCLLFALLAAVPAIGQTGQTQPIQSVGSAPADSSQSNEKQKNDQKAAAEKAGLDLLNQVIIEAGGLTLPENRVHMLASAAQLLWKRDQARARSLFQEAANTLAASIHALDPGDPEYSSQYQIMVELRQELSTIVAPLDAAMALDFLTATKLPPNGDPGALDDMEKSLKLQVASQMAETDPKQALQLAESLRKNGAAGQELIPVLRALQSSDANAAQKLAGDLAADLGSQDLAANPQAAAAALSLLSTALSQNSAASQGQPQAQSPSGQPASNQPTALLTPQAVSNLINQLTAALGARPRPALAAASESQVIMAQAIVMDGAVQGRAMVTNFLLPAQLRALLPAIQQYDSRQGAALAQKLGPLTQDNEVQASLGLQDDATVDDILAAASKADPSVRQALSMQAINKAATDGDFDRARQIAGNIADPAGRQQALDGIDQQAASKASEQDKLESAWRTASRIRTKDTRIAALVQLAGVAVEKSQLKLAHQILADAQSQLSRAENYNQLNLMFAIAALLSKMDPERTIDVFHPAADQLNSVIAAASVLNGFDVQFFRNGELLLQSDQSPLVAALESMGTQLALIAQKDPASAIQAASGIQLPAAALAVRFHIARNLLSPDDPDDPPAVMEPAIIRSSDRNSVDRDQRQ